MNLNPKPTSIRDTPADSSTVIALDLGGTWIKGAARTLNSAAQSLNQGSIQRWQNPLSSIDSAGHYAEILEGHCRSLVADASIRQVVISTAGEVLPSGKGYRIAAPHLAPMANASWLELLEAALQCPVFLLNDADAFLLGLAEDKQLPLRGNIAGIAVGTGLGFSLVRDGRRWMPGRRLNLLGAIATPGGNYDRWASAVHVPGNTNHNLADFLQSNSPECAAYLDGLAQILASASMLYHLDMIFMGGGLSDAAMASGFPLSEALSKLLPCYLLPTWKIPEIQACRSGNLEVLRGALGLAEGLSTGEGICFSGNFMSLSTEAAGEDDHEKAIENRSPEEICMLLANAEHKASENFLKAAPALGREAGCIAEAIEAGGRVISVGAGTSGRLAALDAVEIPCTFGLPRERFVALIAGGLSDACLSIEEESEEDDSAVPELMLLQPGTLDVVIGISASGSAFFVRSALAYAKSRGSHTLLLHEGNLERTDFCESTIRLHSGPELVRGSTRMKAGTATKKALNVLSTTAMVLLGKVRSGCMIDLDPSNRKLQERAARILADLRSISTEEARSVLTRNHGSLRAALTDME